MPAPSATRSSHRQKIVSALIVSSASVALIVALLLFQWWEARPRPPKIDPACLARYERIYALEEPQFTIAFGYKDARPARFVGDRYERAFFVQKILAPCPELRPEGACGFTRSETDTDLFTRTVVAPDGRPRTLRLTVLHASAGPDDQENRLNPYQEWLSQSAKDRFRAALKNSTVVFYNGHSRVGGGPDFSPPRINSQGTVLYDHYRSNEPGLRDLIEGLTQPGSEIEILGLFSCASNQLFRERLQGAKRGLAVWSSRELLYFSDALSDSEELLAALIAKECHPQFEKILNRRVGMAGSQLSGF